MKKENKGITLIALIITIVVLLILAVVTISAVNEGSIFAHANNAATKYNAAATEENTLIKDYIEKMAEYDPGEKPGLKYRRLYYTQEQIENPSSPTGYSTITMGYYFLENYNKALYCSGITPLTRRFIYSAI